MSRLQKNILRLVLPVLILLGSAPSCNFLDESPDAVVNSANFYQTESDAVAAVNALYDYMTVGTAFLWSNQFGGIFFNDFWVFQEILSDNANEKITGPGYQSLSEFKHTANNLRVELYWEDLYKTINAANVVIAKVPPIDFDETRKRHLLSEAHFIRALMYYEAVRAFGDVPLLLEPTENIAQSYVARTTKETVYQTIITDLEYAEENLTTTYRSGDGRPTPLGATSMLARVYLNMEEFALCAEKAKEVIDSQEYQLWEDFADIWKIANMNQREVIHSIQFSGTLSEGFKPNQYLVRLLPSGLDKEGEGPENGQGWEVPTEDLLNSFVPLDRRREVTFFDSFTYSDGTTVTFEPHFAKFWDAEAEPRGNGTDADVIYIRYADILLMYAEALNEVNSGPTPEAYSAINQVRKRARFDGENELNILPDLAGLDYQQFKDAILQERRWEFVMEGHRWNDLKRMGKLVEKVTASGKPNATPEAFHEYLPIPQRERNVNSKLTQNTGY